MIIVSASLTPNSNLSQASQVSFIEKSEYSDDFGKNPDLRKMEIFDMNKKVWKISKHFLPVIDDSVLWGASMVALRCGILVFVSR